MRVKVRYQVPVTYEVEVEVDEIDDLIEAIIDVEDEASEVDSGAPQIIEHTVVDEKNYALGDVVAKARKDMW